MRRATRAPGRSSRAPCRRRGPRRCRARRSVREEVEARLLIGPELAGELGRRHDGRETREAAPPARAARAPRRGSRDRCRGARGSRASRIGAGELPHRHLLRLVAELDAEIGEEIAHLVEVLRDVAPHPPGVELHEAGGRRAELREVGVREPPPLGFPRRRHLEPIDPARLDAEARRDALVGGEQPSRPLRAVPDHARAAAPPTPRRSSPCAGGCRRATSRSRAVLRRLAAAGRIARAARGVGVLEPGDDRRDVVVLRHVDPDVDRHRSRGRRRRRHLTCQNGARRRLATPRRTSRSRQRPRASTPPRPPGSRLGAHALPASVGADTRRPTSRSGRSRPREERGAAASRRRADRARRSASRR